MSSLEELRRLDAELAELEESRKVNQLAYYEPYPKQMEFHAAGAKYQERLLSAGNQLGKTLSGSFEVAAHLTGEYPEWWPGRTWGRPIRAWVGGESSTVVRDTTQKLLLGDITAGIENLGTGAIPADRIIGYTLHRGVSEGIDTAKIRHKSGGVSIIKFKSYEQLRSKWQGDTIDLLWCDEEPPADLYSEGLARFTATNGMAMMTFTPLKGMSTVVKRFFNEFHPDRIKINMTMDDAGHITPDMKQKILSKYPEHERDCRANGIPMAGEGRIFNIAESVITCEPFAIPEHWVQIIGLDIGIQHPTAACWMAWDRDTDTLYVYGAYRQKGVNIATHAAALNGRGRIPIAWPADAHKRDSESGKEIARIYRDSPHHCLMLGQHATFPDGTVSVEAGILEMQQRMETGRWKVFSNLSEWFEEYRSYHRENGEIIKLDDDLLCASRYGMMMRRFAKPVTRNWHPGLRQAGADRVAPGTDFDVFTGR